MKTKKNSNNNSTRTTRKYYLKNANNKIRTSKSDWINFKESIRSKEHAFEISREWNEPSYECIQLNANVRYGIIDASCGKWNFKWVWYLRARERLLCVLDVHNRILIHLDDSECTLFNWLQFNRSVYVCAWESVAIDTNHLIKIDLQQHRIAMACEWYHSSLNRKVRVRCSFCWVLRFVAITFFAHSNTLAIVCVVSAQTLWVAISSTIKRNNLIIRLYIGSGTHEIIYCQSLKII